MKLSGALEIQYAPKSKTVLFLAKGTAEKQLNSTKTHSPFVKF